VGQLHQKLRRTAVAAGMAAGVLLAAGPARAVQLSPAIAQMYAAVEAVPPTASQMMVCYGFVCRLRYFLHFTPADRAAIAGMMAKGAKSAADERKALQQVFVWFDRRAGKEIGTDKRIARADIRHRADDTNFDCFDTTRNAVSLLLVVREWGLLRHHTIEDPRFRGNLFVGQTPHNTAVLKEKAGGKEWIIDMWTTTYGQVPDVMTLEKWFDEN
jgi:hypothetical protein